MASNFFKKRQTKPIKNYFLLKKFKKQLLLKNSKNTKFTQNVTISTINIIFLKLLFKNKIKTYKKRSLAFHIFKSLTLIYFKILKFNKSLYFNTKLKRIVYKLDPNILKKKAKQKPSPISILLFYFVNLALLYTPRLGIKNFKNARIYAFSRILHTATLLLSSCAEI